MLRRIWVLLDLVVVLVGLGLAVPSWQHGVRTIWFTADAGQPGFGATRYSGPWLLLAMLLVIAAGLAAIDLVARAAGRSR